MAIPNDSDQRALARTTPYVMQHCRREKRAKRARPTARLLTLRLRLTIALPYGVKEAATR